MSRNTEDINPARVLRDTADYLLRNGWIKGAFFADGDGEQPKACVSGAIRAAISTRPVRRGSWRDNLYRVVLSTGEQITLGNVLTVLRDYLTEQLMSDSTWGAEHAVTSWNDDKARTVSQVNEALHAAADRYDAEHGEVQR